MNTKRLRTMDGVVEDTEDEIQDIYKEVLKGIRLKFPKYFWFDDGMVNLYHAKVVTKYLIEDILKWNKDEVTKSFNSALLRQYKLSGMLHQVFGTSPMAVLENAYPGVYDPKEMLSTCMRHDDSILQKESLRLRNLCRGLSHEEIVKRYDHAFCVKNRFITLMQSKEADISKFQLLDTTFPGEFYEWEFIVPKGFWTIRKNRRCATLWLMEKEGTKALTIQHFTENEMSRILYYGKGLNNTICEALGIQQEQYREEFYVLLCQYHSNGIDLPEELEINYKVIYSWITRKSRPDFSFVVENYDKLVEISKQTENTPEGLYQKILEGKVRKFPSKYWKRGNSYESAAKITRFAVDGINSRRSFYRRNRNSDSSKSFKRSIGKYRALQT